MKLRQRPHKSLIGINSNFPTNIPIDFPIASSSELFEVHGLCISARFRDNARNNERNCFDKGYIRITDHGKCKQRSRTKRINAECNSIHGIFRSDRTACMQRVASLELFHFLIDGAYFYFGTERFKGRMKVNFCISVLHCRVFFYMSTID